jgi:hypothetical protein
MSNVRGGHLVPGRVDRRFLPVGVADDPDDVCVTTGKIEGDLLAGAARLPAAISVNARRMSS